MIYTKGDFLRVILRQISCDGVRGFAPREMVATCHCMACTCTARVAMARPEVACGGRAAVRYSDRTKEVGPGPGRCLLDVAESNAWDDGPRADFPCQLARSFDRALGAPSFF